MLGLLRPSRFHELLSPLTADRVLLIECSELALQRGVLVAPLPRRRELGRRLRDSHVGSRLSLGRRGERGEEVGYGLLLGADESHTDKEVLRRGCLAKEDLLAFVQDANLVKQVVSRLRRLVDGDDRRRAHVLGAHPEVLAELDSVGRVQTSRRVVPALQRCARQRRLSDRDSLPPIETLAFERS